MSHRFKFTTPTDHMEGAWHGAYCEVYEKLFSGMKDKATNVCELGCDGAGFTLSLCDYFPNSKVHTFDISPEPDGIKGNPRIIHRQWDAYTNQTIKRLEGMQCDAIFEDGPHHLDSQIFFVENYPQFLTPWGIAIVEDIQDRENIEKLAKVLPPEFFSAGIDIRHEDERYDSLLMAIWRR